MTSDVEWTYTYNAENRMIQAVKTDDTKIEFKYDFMGRCFEKKKYSWVSSAWQLGSTEKYVWNNYNKIAIYDASDVLQKSMLWGLDINGGFQTAGGVGGLLSVNDTTASYYTIYDGNGNVRVYIDASGNVVAENEYSPFGKVTKTGAKADELDAIAAFSTKPLDSDTGLTGFQIRIGYDPEIGRFISRDPIGINGGVNENNFCNNDTVNRWDYLGLLFDILLDWRDRSKDTPVLGPVNNVFYGGIWAIVNPHHVASTLWNSRSELPERAKAGALAAQNFMTFGLDKYWFDLVGHPNYTSNFNKGYNGAQNGIFAFLMSQITLSSTKYLTQKCVEVIPVKSLSRRAYLNKKFNRTGNLHGDINARSGIYPPKLGFEAGTREIAELQKGMSIDRYGGVVKNGVFQDKTGFYASTPGASFSSRSLPLVYKSAPRSIYKVMKPFKVESGIVAPWFGQSGKGTQYVLPDSIENLVKQGYLKLVKRYYQ